MSFLHQPFWSQFLTSAGVFSAAVSLDEPSFESSTILVVEVLLLGGGFGLLFFNVCRFFCGNCANCVKPDRTAVHKQRITTLLVTKNHNNSTHYREIKNYISHSEQRLEILVWEKKVVLIICVNYVDKRIQQRQRTIQ